MFHVPAFGFIITVKTVAIVKNINEDSHLVIWFVKNRTKAEF